MQSRLRKSVLPVDMAPISITRRIHEPLKEKKLINAAREGDLDAVKHAIRRGADVNARSLTGMTAMMLAAYWNHPDIVEFLIRKGGDVNARSMTGNTALMSVAKSPIADHAFMIAKLLVESGAHIHATDKYGMTARTMILDMPELDTQRSRELRKVLGLLDGRG